MSNLTDLITAAISGLQSRLNTGNGAVTPADIVAKIHEVVDPQIAALNDSISAIHATDASDEAKLADVTAAITQFATAFAPATTPASSAPTAPPAEPVAPVAPPAAPETPAPESAPESAPETAA